MWFQVVGWFGVVAILVAYTSVTFDLLLASNIVYLLLNGAGAAALIVQSYMIRNYQLIVLNVVWLAVAFIGIIQNLLQ